MPTRRQLIQKITLNANSNSITFSNIPQNYTDLKIFVSARATGSYDATPWVTASFRFNGSSSGYTARTLFGTGSASGSDSNAGGPLLMPDTDSTSGTFGNSNVYIPNYSSTSITKSLIATSVTENNGTSAAMWNYAMSWSNTSPITSIQITSGAGDLAANSTFYLYGITQVPIIRGGTVTVPGDGFKYHTFRSSGSLQVIEPGDVEYLVVAGGGGGGDGRGPGGGAGGMLTGRNRLPSGIASISIGGGGITKTTGSNSSISNLIISSGGGGAANINSGSPSEAGKNGGSGGGGAPADGSVSGIVGGAGGAGIVGQGNNGGNGTTTNLGGWIAGGGGGGAGSAGSNATGNGSSFSNHVGGTGGAGRLWNSVFYAGGGAGSGINSSGQELGSLGGAGGGGNSQSTSTNGQVNTGGGGASGSNPFSPGIGGSGIVIIRYPYDGN